MSAPADPRQGSPASSRNSALRRTVRLSRPVPISPARTRTDLVRGIPIVRQEERADSGVLVEPQTAVRPVRHACVMTTASQRAKSAVRACSIFATACRGGWCAFHEQSINRPRSPVSVTMVRAKAKTAGRLRSVRHRQSVRSSVSVFARRRANTSEVVGRGSGVGGSYRC